MKLQTFNLAGSRRRPYGVEFTAYDWDTGVLRLNDMRQWAVERYKNDVYISIRTFYFSNATDRIMFLLKWSNE